MQQTTTPNNRTAARRMATKQCDRMKWNRNSSPRSTSDISPQHDRNETKGGTTSSYFDEDLSLGPSRCRPHRPTFIAGSVAACSPRSTTVFCNVFIAVAVLSHSDQALKVRICSDQRSPLSTAACRPRRVFHCPPGIVWKIPGSERRSSQPEIDDDGDENNEDRSARQAVIAIMITSQLSPTTTPSPLY